MAEQLRLKNYLDQLYNGEELSREVWAELIRGRTPGLSEYLFSLARRQRKKHYGSDVYIRGLIEFSNYCKNDCFYCGIRKSNRAAHRFRLDPEAILDCCDRGYALGFRTFVLQSGEDGFFTDEKLTGLIRKIRVRYPDCAITLSIGEKSYESYRKYFEAGADRYLLRHETYDPDHYAKLHPYPLQASARQQCLWDLKEIGYQVGTGFIVGSPGQTPEHLAEDLLFIRRLNPQMVGIGPFIPHKDTPFADRDPGTLELTLFLLGLLRLLLPKVLLPATTALGTIHPRGRELGILAGANVVMPNLSPSQARKNYTLYNNKSDVANGADKDLLTLRKSMQEIGFPIVTARGDSLNL